MIGEDSAAGTLAGLRAWTPQVAAWLAEGKEPFVFVHQPENLESPALARAFHAEVSARRARPGAAAAGTRWPGVDVVSLSRRVLLALGVAGVLGLAACSDQGGDEDDGRPVVAIVGDSYTAGWRVGGLGETNWTARPGRPAPPRRLRVDMVVEAGGGSGYVATGWRNLTFGQMAVRGVPRDADVVIVFGSINDSLAASDPQQVRRSPGSCTTGCGRTGRRHLIVIGPSPIGDEVDPALATISRDRDRGRRGGRGHGDRPRPRPLVQRRRGPPHLHRPVAPDRRGSRLHGGPRSRPWSRPFSTSARATAD